MKITPINNLTEIEELKEAYMKQTTAPLDGMWLCGFVPQASHYGIHVDEELCGYFCVNQDDYILQFYIASKYQQFQSEIFDLCVNGRKGAYCSTAEPYYLSHCLDNYNQFKVHTIMYQLLDDHEVRETTVNTNMRLAIENEVQTAVDFVVRELGFPEEWLKVYFSDLVKRRALFLVLDGTEIIATGECRDFQHYQTQNADLGVIVAEAQRKKGLATEVLKSLSAIAKNRGLKPICSTESGNIAAQKAIQKAGFYAPNRILEFSKL